MDQTVQPAAQPARVPTLVKIIAMVYLLTGVLGVFGSIAVLILGFQYGFLSPFARFGIWGASAIFAFGIIAYLVSRGLRRGHNWARRIAIIISVTSVVATFYNHTTIVHSNIFQILINILIVIYLLVNRRVLAAFKQ